MRKILLFLVLGVSVVSCKKTPEGCNGNYSPISQSYLNYWFFPNESYWIYKAKDQELYDTVKVIRAIVSNNDFVQDQKVQEQYVCEVRYEDLLNHSYYNTPTERDHFFASGSKDNEQPTLTYRTKLKNSFPIYLYREKSSFQDSAMVLGKNYKDILMFNEPQRIVFASGVGIIQVMADDSIFWELKEYKIGG